MPTPGCYGPQPTAYGAYGRLARCEGAEQRGSCRVAAAAAATQPGPKIAQYDPYNGAGRPGAQSAKPEPV